MLPAAFGPLHAMPALRLNVFGDFTYTIETIIQARLGNLRVLSVPVRVNGPTRPSRLFRSNLGYICRAALTVINVFAIYRPVRLFFVTAGLFAALAMLLGGRYFVFMLEGEGAGHVQSVIVFAILALCGVFMAAIGIIAHLQGINRRLLEEIRYLLRKNKPPCNHDPTSVAETEGVPLIGTHSGL